MQTPKKELQTTVMIAVVGMVAILGYLTIITVFKGNIELRVRMSDVVIPFFNMLAVLGLLYAAKNSKRWGKRIYLPWILLLIGQSLYFMGDINWAVLNILFNNQPFTSSVSILYLLSYLFFALGIIYFPRPESKQKKFKTILDIVIVSISSALFLGVFLSLPSILQSTENPLWLFLSVLYIILGFILFYISYDLIFNKIKDLSDMILILLILSLTLDIITNFTFYYFLLNNTYISGSFIDAGWLVSNLLVGLAGLIEGNKMKHSFPETAISKDPKKFGWTSYVPLILVCASYIIINTRTNLSSTDLVFANVGMGMIIFLVVIRQILSINENKQLYLMK
jgi:two-component system, sensor histidine kinase PdtaS